MKTITKNELLKELGDIKNVEQQYTNGVKMFKLNKKEQKNYKSLSDVYKDRCENEENVFTYMDISYKKYNYKITGSKTTITSFKIDSDHHVINLNGEDVIVKCLDLQDIYMINK